MLKQICTLFPVAVVLFEMRWLFWFEPTKNVVYFMNFGNKQFDNRHSRYKHIFKCILRSRSYRMQTIFETDDGVQLAKHIKIKFASISVNTFICLKQPLWIDTLQGNHLM